MTKRLRLALQPPLDGWFPPGLEAFEAQGDTVQEVLAELDERHDGARTRLLGTDGGLSPYVHVFVNGTQVPPEAAAGQALRDGDELCLMTAIRGG